MLRAAVELAREVNDLALLLRTASLLLAVNGDDELLAEAGAAARRIASSLPDGLRVLFEAAEPVRGLASFVSHGG